MKHRPPSLTFLDEMLSGDVPDEARIVALINSVKRENQWLDYKSGTQLNDQKAGRAVVRQWVSGFANADGGTLVIGVNEDKPRTVDGCRDHVGGQSIDGWLSDILAEIAPRLGRQPRIHLVQTASGLVAIISTARSTNLVPLVENGRLQYFMRFDDKTLLVPDFLLGDLMLGRRQQPNLLVTPLGLGVAFNPRALIRQVRAHELRLELQVECDGIVPADEVRAGFISWSLWPTTAPVKNSHLRTLVDARPPLSKDARLTVQVQPDPNGAPLSVAPFETTTLNFVTNVPVHGGDGHAMHAALYLLPRSATPIWYQVEIAYHAGLEHNPPATNAAAVKIVPLHADTPLVGW